MKLLFLMVTPSRFVYLQKWNQTKFVTIHLYLGFVTETILSRKVLVLGTSNDAIPLGVSLLGSESSIQLLFLFNRKYLNFYIALLILTRKSSEVHLHALPEAPIQW